MSRLPTVGGDDNTWGNILNDYLSQEHNADGSQKTLDITKGGTGATSAAAALTNLGAASTSSLTGKADDSTVVHLAGSETITGAKDFTGGLTANGNNLLSKLQDASDAELIPADYVIWMDGATARATSLAGGTNYSGTDPAAMAQSAINALGTGGGTIILRGSLSWGSVPTIPKNISSLLHIRGLGSTKITLSSGGPRFLDFNKSADYDTFQNIEITDLLIDVNNVGGRHHSIIGTYVAGTTMSRINLQNIGVRRIHVINAPTDPTITNHRLHVWFSVNHPNPSETQTVIKSIVVEDCNLEGGNGGVSLTGTGQAVAGNNIYIDDVHIRRVRHVMSGVPTAFFATSNFQIGSRGFGGHGTIKDCYGANSGDVGVEINAMTTVEVENVEIQNCWNIGFYHTNYNNPENPNSQTITFENCVARQTDIASGYTGSGFKSAGNLSIGLGTIIYDKCRAYRGASGGSLPTSGTDCFAVNNVTSVKRVVYDKCGAISENWNHTDTTASNIFCGFMLDFNNSSGETVLEMKDIFIRFAGQRSGGSPGAITYAGIKLDGQAAFQIENVTYDIAVTNASLNGTRLVEFGNIASTLRGRFAGLKIKSLSDDTGARGFVIRPTATLSVNGRIDIENCDFTGLGASSTDVLFTSVPQNQDKVFFSHNTWRIFPKPSAAMSASNFASATFTSATANQYLGGDPADIHFANGSGAGVTAIDVSKDGTTYENAYTQPSGALANSVLVPVDNGDYVKVTFTTTQPTTRVRFRR